MACDPKSLNALASCLACLSEKQLLAINAYLLCQISTGGGGAGSSGITFGNYAGGQPNFTPATGTGAAVDTSNQTFWVYDNGAWNQLV